MLTCTQTYLHSKHPMQIRSENTTQIKTRIKTATNADIRKYDHAQEQQDAMGSGAFWTFFTACCVAAFLAGSRRTTRVVLIGYRLRLMEMYRRRRENQRSVE